MINGMRPSNCASTSAAVRALGCPDKLAEVTARGPVRRSSASATGWSGMRTPTVGSGDKLAGQRRVGRDDQGQRPGPEGAGQAGGQVAERSSHLRQVGLIPEQHGNRLGGVTPFNDVKLINCRRICQHGPQTIHRIGGEGDQLAGAQQPLGLFQSPRIL